MKYKELLRIKECLDKGKTPKNIDWYSLREELADIFPSKDAMNESLSLSDGICPACGRPL